MGKAGLRELFHTGAEYLLGTPMPRWHCSTQKPVSQRYTWCIEEAKRKIAEELVFTLYCGLRSYSKESLCNVQHRLLASCIRSTLSQSTAVILHWPCTLVSDENPPGVGTHQRANPA